MYVFQARNVLRMFVASGAIAASAACSNGTPSVPATGVMPVTAGSAAAFPADVRANLLIASGRGFSVNARRGSTGAISAAAKAGSHVIYSGNFNTSTITIYPSKGTNPPPIGTISTGLASPERLFVDKNLNLYATNIGSPEGIVVYKPGGTSPKLTITNGVSSPTGITVGADGTVYCANTGGNTVTEYPKGKTSPSLTITLSSETPENLAVDSRNRLYIQYLGGPLGSGVIEVRPGKTSGTDLNLNIGNAGALAVDRSGNVVILDVDRSTIDVFPPGQTTPTQTLPLSGVPFELSMSKSEKQVYVSSEVGTPFDIEVADYPKLKSVKAKLSPTDGDWPLAVAPDNAL